MNVPKPNLSWLYIIIIAALGILYFSSDEGSVKKDVSYTEFKEMVNNNYASKIIAYDDNTVDMFTSRKISAMYLKVIPIK